MHKTAYTTAETIERDGRGWIEALGPWLRRASPVPLDAAALLVIDAQRWFFDPDSPAFLPAAPAIEGPIRELVEAFRLARRPVLFTCHADPDDDSGAAMNAWWGRRFQAGSPWFSLASFVRPATGEPVLTKATYSAFERTDLADRLSALEVKLLVLAGVHTHLCVETTARHAFTAGFTPIVVADATAAPDLDLHLGALRGLGHGVCRIVTASDVCSGLGLESPSVSPAEPSFPRPVDLLVAGAGPAGIAAAVQARRQGLDVVLVDPREPGGLVTVAHRVENLPAFPGGIRGRDLAARLKSHARASGVELHGVRVCRLAEADGGWEATFDSGASLRARTVILATGTRPRRLNVSGEDADHRVFHRVDEVPRCASVGIVGGGDCAFDSALTLREQGTAVTVLIRGERPRALELLVQRARSAGVTIRTGTVPTKIREDGSSVVIDLDTARGLVSARFDAILVSVGRLPCLPDVEGGTDVLTRFDLQGRTGAPGLYLAGDCRRGLTRQVAVAMGDGVAAAMDVSRYLTEGKWS